MQLLVGTLNLPADLAVTTEQASVLLPLWNDLKTASMSMGPGQGPPEATAVSDPEPHNARDTQAQIDTLVSQIQAGQPIDRHDTRSSRPSQR